MSPETVIVWSARRCSSCDGPGPARQIRVSRHEARADWSARANPRGVASAAQCTTPMGMAERVLVLVVSRVTSATETSKIDQRRVTRSASPRAVEWGSETGGRRHSGARWLAETGLSECSTSLTETCSA